MLVNDNDYKFVLLLHIASVVVAFAPAVVGLLVRPQLAGEDAAVRGRFMGYMAANGRRVHAPALILAGLFGIALILMSDDVIEFDDVWVNLAMLVWFVMNGVLHAMILPAQRKVAAGDGSVASRIATGQMIINVLFVLMLYLMIFQPN